MQPSFASFLTFMFCLMSSISASPLEPRDNQCTACRAIFTKVQETRPAALFDCSSTDQERIDAFNTQICDTFTPATSNPPNFGAFVNSYCHSLVQEFGNEQGQLFTAVQSQYDPGVLCHEKFRSC